MVVLFRHLKMLMLGLAAICISGCSLEASLLNLAKLAEPTISVELTSPHATTSNASVIPVTVTLSEDVQDLTAAQIQVTNGTIANFSGSGSVYSFDIIPNGDGVVSVLFPETSLLTAVGDTTKKTDSGALVFTVDTTRPTVNLTTSATNPTNVASIPVNVVFSEGVTDLSISDFVVTGGGAAITSLTGSGSSYVVNLLATVSGVITIQLPASTVIDVAANPNFASNTLSITYDVNTPLPVLGSLASSTNNLSSIPVTVSFGSVSVSNLTDSDFTVTNGTISGFTGSGSSYSLNLIPSGDGAVTIHLPAGVAENSLGTLNLASNTLTFNVDRVAPTLAIVGPTPSVGNSATNFVWTVNYSGASAISLVSGDISLGGSATAGCAAVVSGAGLSSRTVTVSGCSGNGNLNISIPANSAQDAAGNQALAVGPSSDATIDNNGPSLAIVGPTPTIGRSTTSFVWTVNYTGASTVTLVNGNISLGGTATAGCSAVVSGSGTSSRTVTVTGCSGNGSVNISIAANSAQDSLGNQAPAEGPSSDATVDNTAPTLVIGSASPTVGNSSATFSWPVTYTGADSVTLSSGMISLNGTATAGCVATVTGTGTTNRVVEINGCTATSGTLGFSIAANSAQDSVGNQALAAGPSGLVTIDNNNLTIGLSSVASPTNNLSSIPVTVTTSASTSDFVVGDLTLVNATVTGFSGSGTSYTFNLIPSGDGTVSVQVPAGAAHDSVPNANLASNLLSFNVDRVAPTLAIVGPTPTLGNSSTSFVWTVNYSNADSVSLVSGDVVLGGTATAGCSAVVTGTGTASRTVTVSGCSSNGSLNISIPANSSQDTAGNQSLAAGPSSDATVDNTAPTLAITGPTPSVGNSTTSFVWTVTYTNADAVTLAAADITLGGTATVGCTKAVTGSGTSTRTVTISNCSGNGNLNISVAANSAQDLSGNQAAAAGPSSDATVDNAVPTLAISGPTPSVGNSATNFVWTVTYTGADTVTLADADISLGGTATASCTKAVTGSGSTTRTVTISNCSGNGSLNISVAANSAHDNAGNQAAAAGPSSNATVDNTGPTLALVGPTPALGKSSTSFVWNLNYTDASSMSLVAGDISLTGTATADCSVALTGSGLLTRTVTVTNCSGTGNVGISVAANTAQDALGNLANSATSTLATVDNTAPTLAITGPTPSTGNSATSFVWTVTYTGADTVTLADANISLGGTATAGCTKAVTGTGTTTRTVTISNCSGNGSLNISVAANSAQDTVGNQAAAAGPSSDATVDNTGPTLAITGPTPTLGNSTASFVWTVTYTDAASVTLAAADITLAGPTSGCLKAVTGSGTSTRTVTISNCTGNGNLTISVAANSAQDSLMNPSLAAGPSSSATIDNSPPTVAFLSPVDNGLLSGDMASVTIDGLCFDGTGEIIFTPPAKNPVYCVSNAWSATFDLSAVTDEMVRIRGDWLDAAGNSGYGYRDFVMPTYRVVKIFSNQTAFAALRSDGSVVSWGYSSNGGNAPSSVTSANSDVIKIYNTDSAFAALKSDGSVVSWGTFANAIPAPASVTAAGSGVIEIFKNKDAFVALKSDGSLVAWGNSAQGGVAPGSVTAANSKVVKVFATDAAFAALKYDGSIVTWGDQSTWTQSPPSQVTDANSKVIDVFSNSDAFAALKSDGTLLGWGNTDNGGNVSWSIGKVKVTSNRTAFALINGTGTVSAWGNTLEGGMGSLITDAKKIFGTESTFAALKSDGSVVAWGKTSAWDVGIPSQVTAADSGVMDIFSNFISYAALKSDGSVVAWGHSNWGAAAPASVTAANSKVIKIANTHTAFAALKSNGTVVAWGESARGGTTPVTGNSDVIDIVGNDYAFAALKSDGSVLTWGHAVNGGSPNTLTRSKLSGSKVSTKAITNSGYGSYTALKSDGSAVTWGDIVTSGYSAPASVSSANSKVKTVLGNDSDFAALKSDGSVVSWGGYGAAPAGIAAADSGVAKVFTGIAAFVALKTDGSLTQWGYEAGYLIPASVTNANSKVIDVTSAAYGFAALKSDGSVVSWGYDGDMGDLGPAPVSVSAANSKVVKVYSSFGAFAALKADGSVVAWGHSGMGGVAPASVTTVNSGVVKISSNGFAFAALKSDGSVVAWGYQATAPVSVTAANSGVVDIYANGLAFAAVKGDGSVVSWAQSLTMPATPAEVADANSGVKIVDGTYEAFAALRADGSVIAWGYGPDGRPDSGDPSNPVAVASGVKSVVSADIGAFAALKADGSVVAWGNTGGGAAPSSVTSANAGVCQLYSDQNSFAALKSDGSVVTWGNNSAGGDSTGVNFKDP